MTHAVPDRIVGVIDALRNTMAEKERQLNATLGHVETAEREADGHRLDQEAIESALLKLVVLGGALSNWRLLTLCPFPEDGPEGMLFRRWQDAGRLRANALNSAVHGREEAARIRTSIEEFSTAVKKLETTIL